MTEFRKGIVKPQVSTPQAQPSSANIPRARVVKSREPDQPSPQRSMIIQPNQPREPAVRGVLVDTSGRLHRGLSPATIQAHQAHNENATEQCKNCGEFRTPAQMGTVIGNAYNPNNPLRICSICKGLAYRDPNDPSQRWEPKMPQIRFNREQGNPYDTRRSGITMSDLVNRDTYHEEYEASSEQRTQLQAPRTGQWSGGSRAGHTHTQASLEQSRERARRR